MSQRRVSVPPIGEVVLSRRRGATNMRLSINGQGQVRVGLPYWTPYEAGLAFINKQIPWILKHQATHAPKQIQNGCRVGKAHTIIFQQAAAGSPAVDTRITKTAVRVRTNLDPANPLVQKRAYDACERALKLEAEQLLPIRVKDISSKYQIDYRSLRIRKLTSRWGSCSSKKDISLSYYLIQLPWELIDYVILHELSHTQIHNHSSKFWEFMEEKLPSVRVLRKQIKEHKPRVEPSY